MITDAELKSPEFQRVFTQLFGEDNWRLTVDDVRRDPIRRRMKLAEMFGR